MIYSVEYPHLWHLCSERTWFWYDNRLSSKTPGGNKCHVVTFLLSSPERANLTHLFVDGCFFPLLENGRSSCSVLEVVPEGNRVNRAPLVSHSQCFLVQLSQVEAFIYSALVTCVVIHIRKCRLTAQNYLPQWSVVKHVVRGLGYLPHLCHRNSGRSEGGMLEDWVQSSHILCPVTGNVACYTELVSWWGKTHQSCFRYHVFKNTYCRPLLFSLLLPWTLRAFLRMFGQVVKR